jgi:hypothetical protein
MACFLKGLLNGAAILSSAAGCFLTLSGSLIAQTSSSGLQITSSNGLCTVSWPLTDYDGILQGATDLSPAGTWTNLAAADPIMVMNTFPVPGGNPSYPTSITNNQFTLSLPVANRQQFYRIKPQQIIPACLFAIFYNGTLEFSYCASMVINGRVHANGPIYVGTIASASLTFNAPVTTSSLLAAPNLDGTTTNQWDPNNSNTWNVVFNGNPRYITNVPAPGILQADTNNNYHILIDFPTSSQTGVNANYPTNWEMLYNQAQIVLVVTNSSIGGTPTVSLILQTSQALDFALPGFDPNPNIYTFTNATPASLSTNLQFLSLTNYAYDQRESKTNLFTQIDVGWLATWMSTNSWVQGKLPSSSSLYPTILYVADRRNHNAQQLPSVRLVNGAQLPSNNGLGFSVATPNPLYVKGNYNVTAWGGTTTGTNNAYEVPAALLSDSLTILSPSWTDNESFTAFNSSIAADNASTMTINAAIVTGTVPSTGTNTYNYSGGVHNLPRLLENWTSVPLYLNTSIIRLWDSQMATNQWKYQGTYYLPPARFFSFDQNFLNSAKIPPGIPVFANFP